MKIVYIHQYFRKPTQSGGTRSYWIAKELVERNHDVLIITSDNNLKSSKETEVYQGIKILYLNVPYSNNLGFYKRLKAFVSFMLKSCYYALKESKVDLVFATSTPLTVGFPALLRKWFKKTPYVFEVRDLWPEVPIQMGALQNPILRKLAVFFEKTIYKNAVHIIALSPGMQKGVLRFVSQKNKVSMIPNMSKIDEFYPRKITPMDKENLGLDNAKFNCIHFGAMGKANGLEYVFQAAKYAQTNQINHINFIFLGEGNMFSTYQKFVKENKLTNVKFLGTKPLKEVSEIVNACDLSIVSFKNLEILKTNSPNKLFDSLSAGKPIIVNSSGWTKAMIEDNNSGLFTNPLDPTDLVEKIITISSDDNLRETMGKNARLLAENKYDKSILVPKIINKLESAI